MRVVWSSPTLWPIFNKYCRRVYGEHDDHRIYCFWSGAVGKIKGLRLGPLSQTTSGQTCRTKLLCLIIVRDGGSKSTEGICRKPASLYWTVTSHIGCPTPQTFPVNFRHNSCQMVTEKQRTALYRKLRTEYRAAKLVFLQNTRSRHRANQLESRTHIRWGHGTVVA